MPDTTEEEEQKSPWFIAPNEFGDNNVLRNEEFLTLMEIEYMAFQDAHEVLHWIDHEGRLNGYGRLVAFHHGIRDDQRCDFERDKPSHLDNLHWMRCSATLKLTNFPGYLCTTDGVYSKRGNTQRDREDHAARIQAMWMAINKKLKGGTTP